MPAWTEKKESDLMISIMISLGNGKKPQCSWGTIIKSMEEKGHKDLTIGACSHYFGRLWEKWVNKGGDAAITNNNETESKPQKALEKPRTKESPKKTPKKAGKAAALKAKDAPAPTDDETNIKKALLKMKQRADDEYQMLDAQDQVRIKLEPHDAGAADGDERADGEEQPRAAGRVSPNGDRRKRRRSGFTPIDNFDDGSV